MTFINGLKVRTRTLLILGLGAAQLLLAQSTWAGCPLPPSLDTVGIPSPATFTPFVNNGYLGLPDGGSYQKVTIAPNGSYLGGDYKAWCSDAAADISIGATYTANIIDSKFTTCPNAVHDSCVPPVIYVPDAANPPDACVWNQINYLINHKIGNADSVQAAIWDLISPAEANSLATIPNIVQADRDAMVAAARANSSFVPGPTDLRAAILYVQDDVQIVFIEVPPTNCQCTLTFTPPANVTLCPADGVPAAEQNLTAVDSCVGVVPVAWTGDTETGSCPKIITRTYSATDGCGKKISNVQIITVQDTTPPVIACSTNITQNTDAGKCSAVVNYDVTATDICSSAIVTCIPPSGSVFNKGETTVNCTAVDLCMNSSVCSFTVTIVDHQPPAISCPADITTNVTAIVTACTAVVEFQPTATDNCGLQLPIVCVPPSGSTFPSGPTQVTCTATDISGNAISCSFKVTVLCKLPPPLISCPPDTSISCTNVPHTCTFTATQGGWGAPPNGNNIGMLLKNNFALVYPNGVEIGIPGAGGFSMKFNSQPAIQAYLPAGSTASSLTSDLVNPTSSPAGVFGGQVLALQLNVDFGYKGISLGSAGPVGNLVYSENGSPLSGKTISNILAIANVALGGGALPSGVTISLLNNVVTSLNEAFDNCNTTGWAAAHLSGSSAPPAAGTPNTGTATASGGCGNLVISFTDFVTATGIDRTWMVIDGCNQTASCVQHITIDDKTPPSIVCPAPIVVANAAGQCSAIVNYTVKASDNCSGVNTVCTVPSGSSFPVGTTTVTCTATDGAGHTAQCSFTVTVKDTQAPAIVCPAAKTANVVAGTCTASVSFAATATDNCGGPVTLSYWIGSTPIVSPYSFPAGFTTVTVKAVDAANNTSTCNFTVVVTDNLPPVISGCPTDKTAYTTATSCGAVVTWTAPTASDNCGGSIPVTCVPASGSTFPAGTTTVKCTAKDSANTAACTFKVIVIDDDAPVIKCSTNIVAAAPFGYCSAIVTYNVSASDNCSGATVTCVPPSGSSFSSGVTMVSCTAADGAGNKASCAFSVTVKSSFNVTISVPLKVNAGTITNTASVTAGPAGTIYTWTIVNGSITAGLNTPKITWTAPSTACTTTIKVTVTTPSGCSGSAFTNVTVLSGPVGFTSYTQGGWGTVPSGNNPGSLLQQRFPTLYPYGFVLGGTYTIKLTSQLGVQNYLPDGGTPSVLKKSYTNPTATESGVLGAQTTALRLNVDFSAKGYTKVGLGNLKVAPGNKLAGQTVNQVLALANKVLGGTTSALPVGVSISDLSGVCDSINRNYDNGTSNNGFLVY
jgi:hypothetical protein